MWSGVVLCVCISSLLFFAALRWLLRFSYIHSCTFSIFIISNQQLQNASDELHTQQVMYRLILGFFLFLFFSYPPAALYTSSCCIMILIGSSNRCRVPPLVPIRGIEAMITADAIK